MKSQSIYNVLSFLVHVNIQFIKHAKEQMKERGISEDEVIHTIKY